MGAAAFGSRLTACRDTPETTDHAGSTTAVPPTQKAPRRSFDQPNIVYFFADQHRADCVSPAGFNHIQTPTLAGLAEQGIVFGNCHTNAPLCRPARSSMMTGLYPREHGVWTNSRSIPASMKNHVQRIRNEAGYHTAVIGKTHLHFGTGHLDCYKDLLDEFGFSHAHELTGPLHVSDTRSAYTDWLSRKSTLGEKKNTSGHGNIYTITSAGVGSAPGLYLHQMPIPGCWTPKTTWTYTPAARRRNGSGDITNPNRSISK